MYKINRKEIAVLIILFFVVTILVSALTAYFITRGQANIHFVAKPREDNPDYGYIEISGKRYYQLYTTTQVNMENNLHYHRIDLRSSDEPKN